MLNIQYMLYIKHNYYVENLKLKIYKNCLLQKTFLFKGCHCILYILSGTAYDTYDKKNTK